MTMTHDEMRELIQRELDDDLTAKEKELLEEHVAACAECREERAVFGALTAQLFKLDQVMPERSFVAGMAPVIAETVQARQRPKRMRSWSRGLSAAAAVLLGIVVTTQWESWIRPSQPQEQVQIADVSGTDLAKGNALPNGQGNGAPGTNEGSGSGLSGANGGRSASGFHDGSGNGVSGYTGGSGNGTSGYTGGSGSGVSGNSGPSGLNGGSGTSASASGGAGGGSNDALPASEESGPHAGTGISGSDSAPQGKGEDSPNDPSSGGGSTLPDDGGRVAGTDGGHKGVTGGGLTMAGAGEPRVGEAPVLFELNAALQEEAKRGMAAAAWATDPAEVVRHSLMPLGFSPFANVSSTHYADRVLVVEDDVKYMVYLGQFYEQGRHGIWSPHHIGRAIDMTAPRPMEEAVIDYVQSRDLQINGDLYVVEQSGDGRITISLDEIVGREVKTVLYDFRLQQSANGGWTLDGTPAAR